MKEGSVVLTPLHQSDGRTKNRPVIALRKMRPFGDWHVCGVSTQLHQQVLGFDELIQPSDSDFSSSGLKASSIIKLGFLAVLPASSLVGSIGFISSDRHNLLLQRLSQYLSP